MTDSIRIASHLNGHYDVSFAASLEALSQKIDCYKDAVIFIDTHVQALYPEWAEGLALLAPVFAFHSEEENKTLPAMTHILDRLAEAGVTRQSVIIAVGGGILHDAVSFAAHIYYRGLRTVLVPTTLLAMCDSSVGGKCALNFHGHKNQLGAFHPPAEVIIWDGFLHSLPDEALLSGAGELLKYALMSGQKEYDQFKNAVQRGGARSVATAEWIAQGLQVKKKYVEADEFDKGIRCHLNYGHTFGHAIEYATQYHIPHGVAVAYGIDIVNYIALEKGLLTQNLQRDVHTFIASMFGSRKLSGISAAHLVECAGRDKKMGQDGVNMVFLTEPGKVTVERITLNESLTGCVERYLGELGL